MNNLTYQLAWLIIYASLLALVVFILSGCALKANQADDDWAIRTTTTIEDDDCSASCDAEVSRTQSKSGQDSEVKLPTKLPQ